MAEFKQDLESGTVGAAASTNSGAGGNTAVSGAGTAPTITSTAGEVLSGTKSAKCAAAIATASYLSMPVALTTTATHAYAAMRFMDSAYDNGEQIIIIRNTTTSPTNKYFTLSFNASNQLTVNTAGGTLYTTPSPLVLPGAYMFDILTDSGTTTTDGKLKFRVRNFATGALAGGMTDWVELVNRNMGSGLLTATYQVGKCTTANATAAKTIIVDDLYIGDGYTPGGPIVVPTLTGTVVGSDTFTGTDGSALAAQWTANIASGGSVTISGNQALLTPAPVAWASSVVSTYLSGIPFVQNTDWDLMATLTPKNPLTAQYIAVGTSNNGSLRSGDLLPGHGYAVQLIPASGLLSVTRTTSGVVTNLSGNLPYTYTAGTAVNVRLKFSGGNTVTAWVWDVGTSMPATPTYTAVDPAPLSGGFKPIMSASNGGSSTPAAASIDNFQFASTAATQGVFIWLGTSNVHHVAQFWNGTTWLVMPVQESA